MLQEVLNQELVSLEIPCDKEASMLLEELSDKCGYAIVCGGNRPVPDSGDN